MLQYYGQPFAVHWACGRHSERSFSLKALITASPFIEWSCWKEQFNQVPEKTISLSFQNSNFLHEAIFKSEILLGYEGMKYWLFVITLSTVATLEADAMTLTFLPHASFPLYLTVSSGFSLCQGSRLQREGRGQDTPPFACLLQIVSLLHL